MSSKRTGRALADRRIVEALERLSATLIRTNIRQGKKKRPEGFHWIERYSAPTDDLGRSTGVEFTISDWLYEGVLTDRLVLGIDRAYFKLTGGIERWLYRVVRKHGGHQAAGWAFTMKQLHHKSGSTQRLADFAKELRIAVERQRLPGYWLEFRRHGRLRIFQDRSSGRGDRPPVSAEHERSRLRRSRACVGRQTGRSCARHALQRRLRG